MLCAVRSHAALTDEFGVLQQFAQYNGSIAVSVNVGVRIKHNGELTRKPVCTENKDPHDVGGERQGGEQRLQLFAKAEPAIAGAEDQQRAVTEKQKAQIEQARDAQAEHALHREADEGGEDTPAAPPAQRIEQHGKHQREQQRQAAQENMLRNVDVAEPEPADGQETEQDQCGMEHERERQGEVSEQRKIEKIGREHRRRAEQQRHALMHSKIGQFVVTEAYKRGERKPCKRDECRERKKKLWCFRTVNTVKLRADLIRVARQTKGFCGRGGLVHATRHQRVALVAEVGQKLVFDERPRLFPPQLLSRGASKLGKGFRQSQGRRPLSARDRPQW